MAPHEHQYELPMLSGTEREGRWRRVRQQMSQAGLDCLVAYGAPGSLSALYLTQVDMEGLAIFPLEGDPIFLLPSGERWLHWATDSQRWVRDVRPVSDLASATGEALEHLGARRVGLVDFKGMGSAGYTQLMTR